MSATENEQRLRILQLEGWVLDFRLEVEVLQGEIDRLRDQIHTMYEDQDRVAGVDFGG